MNPSKWFDRKFEFGNANIFPSILERIEGGPILYRAKCTSMPKEILTLQPDGKWSILENLGHIIDLEPLWLGRLQDILNGEDYLRDADLRNKKTHEANHNRKPLGLLLEEFNKLRSITINELKGLKEEDVFKSAKHPRLDVPMRIMDLFLFVAEHDMHHLARISHIQELVSKT